MHRPLCLGRTRRGPDHRPGRASRFCPATTRKRWRRGCWSKSTGSTPRRWNRRPALLPRASLRPLGAATEFASELSLLMTSGVLRGAPPCEEGFSRRDDRVDCGGSGSVAAVVLAGAFHQPRAVLAGVQSARAGGGGEPAIIHCSSGSAFCRSRPTISTNSSWFGWPDSWVRSCRASSRFPTTVGPPPSNSSASASGWRPWSPPSRNGGGPCDPS